MGIFRRMANIFSGKANRALDAMENPIEQLELTIRKKKDAIIEAKKASAMYIGSVDSKQEEINATKQKIKDYEKGILKALKENNEEKAKTFTETKLQLESELKTLTDVYAKISTSAEQTKADIKKLEKDVKELETRKHELSARLTTAEAKAKVNEIIANVDKGSTLSIDDIEAKVKEKENYANGLSSYAPTDSHDDLQSYIASSSADVEDELEKYRKMVNSQEDKQEGSEE